MPNNGTLPDKFEGNYESLIVGALLAAQSQLQRDLQELKKDHLLTTENAQKLLRHALYEKTSAFNSAGEFKPISIIKSNQSKDEFLAALNYDELIGRVEDFFAAGNAIKAIFGNILVYTGGSCPSADEQPGLFEELRQYGARMDHSKLI